MRKRHSFKGEERLIGAREKEAIFSKIAELAEDSNVRKDLNCFCRFRILFLKKNHELPKLDAEMLRADKRMIKNGKKDVIEKINLGKQLILELSSRIKMFDKKKEKEEKIADLERVIMIFENQK